MFANDSVKSILTSVQIWLSRLTIVKNRPSASDNQTEQAKSGEDQEFNSRTKCQERPYICAVDKPEGDLSRASNARKRKESREGSECHNNFGNIPNERLGPTVCFS